MTMIETDTGDCVFTIEFFFNLEQDAKLFIAYVIELCTKIAMYIYDDIFQFYAKNISQRTIIEPAQLKTSKKNGKKNN